MYNSQIKNKIYNPVLGFIAGYCLGEYFEKNEMKFDWDKVAKEKSNIFSARMPFKIIRFMKFYVEKKKRLNSDDFKDLILELSRENLIGTEFSNFNERNTVELLKEGMNPRICGLYAAAGVDTVMLCLPVTLYNYLDSEQAYIDTYYLGNIFTSAEGNSMAALYSHLICEIISKGLEWKKAKEVLLNMASEKDKGVYDKLKMVFAVSEKASDDLDFFSLVFDESLFNMVDQMRFIGNKSYYLAFAVMDYFSNKGEMQDAIVWGVNSIKKYDLYNRPAIRINITVFASMLCCLTCAIKGFVCLPQFVVREINVYYQLEQLTSDFIKLLEQKKAGEYSIFNQMKTALQNNQPDQTALFDKILGGLLAGTLGNVMGSPVENMHYKDIVKKYDRLEKIMDITKIESEDDCDMTMMWAEAFVRKQGRIIPSDLALIWLERMKRNKFFTCMRNAYDLLQKGIEPHAIGHWSIVTGSAVMACAACGIFNAGDSLQAALDGREIAYMYQRGTDVEAASIACAAYAEALNPKATVDSILDAAVYAAGDKKLMYFRKHEPDSIRENILQALEIAEKYNDVFEAREELYGKCLEYHPIDPLEVITLTLAIFKISHGDVWKCMLGGTNIGRDSDTIANIAATLSGFLKGTDSIPAEMLMLINPDTMKNYRNMAKELTKLNIIRLNRFKYELN